MDVLVGDVNDPHDYAAGEREGDQAAQVMGFLLHLAHRVTITITTIAMIPIAAQTAQHLTNICLRA